MVPLYVLLISYTVYFMLREWAGILYEPVAAKTILFSIGTLLSFLIGYFTAFFSYIISSKPNYNVSIGSIRADSIQHDRILRVLLFCSILHILISLLDFYTVRSYYVGGLTEARYLRMAEGIRSSTTGMLKLLTAGFPAVTAAFLILKREHILSSKLILTTAGIFIISLILSFASGGRNGAALMILFAVCAALARKAEGKQLIPTFSFSIKIITSITLSLSILFMLWMFWDREQFRSRDMSDTIENLKDFNVQVNLQTGEGLEVEKTIYLMFAFYVTHSYNELDLLLTDLSGPGPYWGGYNFYEVVLFLNVIGFEFTDATQIRQELIRPGTYLGLLGSRLFVFLYWGTFLAVYLLGFFICVIWRKALKTGGPIWELLSAFNLMSLIAAPIYSVYNIAYGFSILVAIVLLPVIMIFNCKYFKIDYVAQQ
jgi:hypothetical protein